MRLIDADELIYMVIGEDTDNPFSFVPTEFIENAPTIDAEQVVRCKDCKYWNNDIFVKFTEDFPRGQVCTRFKTLDYIWHSLPSDYCSLGERKEDEQN